MLKNTRYPLIRISVLLLVLLITLLTISGRGCSKRSNGKKTGSSDEWPTLTDPYGLTAKTVSPRINLSWSWNGNFPYLQGFQIYRSTNPTDFVQIATVGGIFSYSDIGPFDLFTTYYYYVRAFDAFNQSNPSNVATATMTTPVGINATAGERFSITMGLDGTLLVWGSNEFSQLGLGYEGALTITIPAQLGNDTDWASVDAGYYHTMAVKTNSTLWTWGSNNAGQLGLGTSDSGIPGDPNAYGLDPAQVGSDSDWFLESGINISKIAGGSNHSVALKTNGTLWTWGGNWNGQLGTSDAITRVTPSQVGMDSDWSLVASGGAHTLAIKNNGSLWSWGLNNSGQLGLGYANQTPVTVPTRVGTGSNWSMVAASYGHTIALKTNSTLWAWGAGYTYTPTTQIGTDTDWMIITVGGSDPNYGYDLAVKKNGTLWAWGNNQYGQLGLGNKLNRLSPEQIGSSSDWLTVTAGGYHTVAVTTNSTIYVWGLNDTWQLGLGDSFNRNIPCPLGSPAPPGSLSVNLVNSTINLSWIDQANNEIGYMIERKTNRAGTYAQVTTVASGFVSWIDTTPLPPTTYYYYRIRTFNNFGNSPYSNETAIAVSGNWSKISAHTHTIGLKTNTLWAWGSNDFGQLGLGDSGNETNRNTPTQIGNGSDWSEVSCDYHSIGRKTNGTLWMFGRNNYGQLGLSDTIDRNTPTQLVGTSNWSEVICGGLYTIGIKTNATIWAWGWNDSGRLGFGDTITRTTPTQIGANSDWSSIATGCSSNPGYTIALKTNNTIWGWGGNNSGQLGLADTISRTTPTQLDNGSDWSAVGCGSNHTIGLKVNKSLWAWGFNNSGQLGMGDTIARYTPAPLGTGSDWSAVSCGSNYTIALKTDKTLWSWGTNTSGQLGLGDSQRTAAGGGTGSGAGPEFTGDSSRKTPTQIGIDSDWSAVSCGPYYTIARKTNATIWAWGVNTSGQLGLGDLDNRLIPTLVGE